MPRTAQAVILDLLSQRQWYCPWEVGIHLVSQGCYIAPESTTARMRDLRKKKYGGFTLNKRRVPGKTFYEYRIERQEEKAA